jgi:hypothetical protein
LQMRSSKEAGVDGAPEASEAEPAPLRRRVLAEMVEYYFDFLYLAFFLVAFNFYRRLILAEYDITYLNYGIPLLEAAALAKIIMIGDLVPMGHGFQRRPLIIPTVFRSVLFAVYVLIFALIEHTVTGVIHGKGWMAGILEIESKGRDELLAKSIIVFAAFIPFFAFKELEKVLGKERLRSLFWRNPHAVSEGESRTS